MIRALAHTLALGGMALALMGCAYKPLKAPCSSEEGGVPLGYATQAPPLLHPPLEAFEACGPMKPI